MNFIKAENLIKRYEKIEYFVSPAGLLIGFIWDNLTLRRIDLWLDNLILISYLIIVGLSILFLNAYFIGRLRGRFFDKISLVVPFLMQFSFGGLFSAFLIFYSRSGSLVASWPFLAILVFLLLGNEIFRRRYQRLVFQLCIFFLAIYAYLIFAIPLLVNKLGSIIFLISGFVSLFIIFIFWLILYFTASRFAKESWRWLIGGIGSIYFLFNILYFSNIIPPVPLSLKEGGISHSVMKSGYNYYVKIEPAPWYLFLDDFNPVYHWQGGEAVFCYAAVFAPAKITTKIYHRWLYFDEKDDTWIEASKINYPIFGGRDGGYRGYSLKQNVFPGQWRVEVTTENDQVLGRMNFKIVSADFSPELVTIEY